jgi:hypothetical protein
MSVKDTFLCACTTRPKLSPRLLRYFTVLQVSQPGEDSLYVIYSSILKGFLHGTHAFPQDVRDFGEKGNMVSSTL